MEFALNSQILCTISCKYGVVLYGRPLIFHQLWHLLELNIESLTLTVRSIVPYSNERQKQSLDFVSLFLWQLASMIQMSDTLTYKYTGPCIIKLYNKYELTAHLSWLLAHSYQIHILKYISNRKKETKDAYLNSE